MGGTYAKQLVARSAKQSRMRVFRNQNLRSAFPHFYPCRRRLRRQLRAPFYRLHLHAQSFDIDYVSVKPIYVHLTAFAQS